MKTQSVQEIIWVGFKPSTISSNFGNSAYDPAGHTAIMVTNWVAVQKEVDGKTITLYKKEGYLKIENDFAILITDKKNPLTEDQALTEYDDFYGVMKVTTTKGGIKLDGDDEVYYTAEEIQPELDLITKAEELDNKIPLEYQFNLYFYNCTDFAVELLKKAKVVDNCFVAKTVFVGQKSKKIRHMSTPNKLYNYLLDKGHKDYKGKYKNFFSINEFLKYTNKVLYESNMIFFDMNWEDEERKFENIKSEYCEDECSEN